MLVVKLSRREDSILRLVIEDHVRSAKPVSSSAVVSRRSVGVSSATVRNVMRALEEKGLIYQPHTSAGRVPTDLGYRYYVDNLVRPTEVTGREQAAIERGLRRLAGGDLPSFLAGVSHMMSELSRELAVAVAPASEDDRVERIRYDGARFIFSHPEFADDVSALGELFDSEASLAHVVPGPPDPMAIAVVIGRENRDRGMVRMSLVAGSFRIGRGLGRMGVIGPTRMRYPRLMGLVKHFSQALDERLSNGA